MCKINFEKLLGLKRKIKIAIVGSRDFVDFEEFKEKVTPIFLELVGNIDCIISGGAKGADSLAEEYAKVNKINTVIYRPDWKKYGRGAGIVRNRAIIENSDLVIAFIKNNSRGTTNSIKVARELNKELMVFELDLKY